LLPQEDRQVVSRLDVAWVQLSDGATRLSHVDHKADLMMTKISIYSE
jgi:hypothetical protein